MKIRYVGPYQSVEIAATGQRAENGKQVDVVERVAKQLLKQASWKKVQTPKPEEKKETPNG